MAQQLWSWAFGHTSKIKNQAARQKPDELDEDESNNLRKENEERNQDNLDKWHPPPHGDASSRENTEKPDKLEELEKRKDEARKNQNYKKGLGIISKFSVGGGRKKRKKKKRQKRKKSSTRKRKRKKRRKSKKRRKKR